MKFRTNPRVLQTEAPPIAEALSWINPSPGNRALINLCQAVPSYPPAPAMQAEIARLAGLTSTGFYTDILGDAELRAALASDMSGDYGGQIGADEVAITAGCNQAFCATLMALAEAGDNVILPLPYYFNHAMWLDMLGIKSRHIEGVGATRKFPDPADAARLIDVRTRAIVLCSPNNPTGTLYSPELIAAFYDLCQAHDIALVIDETYKDFRPDLAPPHDLFQRDGWQSTFVQLYSFSKVFAMTGYRVGAIIASHEFMDQIEKVMDCVAICAPAISQGAALYGLRELGDWKVAKRALMADRALSLHQAFERPGLDYKLVSAGAYFAYVEHPFGAEPAKAVAQRLAAGHDLLCLPGSMFGPGQERYLRLAFANVEANTMPEAVDRLIESQKARPS